MIYKKIEANTISQLLYIVLGFTYVIHMLRNTYVCIYIYIHIYVVYIYMHIIYMYIYIYVCVCQFEKFVTLRNIFSYLSDIHTLLN